MKRALFVVALTLSSAALAQDPKYLGFRMLSTAQSPFPYYIDNRQPSPGGFSITAATPAIEAAWNEWNGVQCSMPKAQSQGYTGGQVANPQDTFDNYSVTPVWITNSSDPDARSLLDSGFTLAVSVPRAYAGVLTTCDIFLNGLIYSYSTQTPTAPNDVDLQTVMTHEAGHCLGLDHFGLGLMQGSIVKGEQKRSLTQLDVRGICERNPAFGKAGAQCSADGGCDPNLKCMPRVGTLGPSTYCTNSCLPNTVPCPLPMECQPSTLFSTNNSCQYPNSNVTQVGKACTNNQPDCGSAVGLCIRQTTAPSGTTFWLDGYCSQGCDLGQPACPANSICLPSAQGQKLCIASCRVGLSDCRPGYTCDTTTASGNAGICLPNCRVEADCIDPTENGVVVDYECRQCDGRCVPKQTPGISVGTICTVDSQCGSGQVCRQADRRFTTKQCTLSCARGCGTCPTGSACVPDDRGELYCLKTCSAPRSCGQGLRCADYPGVKACIPACQADTDCPVGQTCRDQECELPVDPMDAGCTFCTVPDAGRPFVPRPDAGVPTGGGNAGCACSTTDAFGPMLMLMATTLAASRRRRR